MSEKNEVSTKADLTTVQGFSQVLQNYEKSIAQLLHTKYGITKEEFFVICVNAVKKNPKLLLCNPKSLFGAVLLSAEVGLRPNTPEQHAFIIPYKKQASFQIGYKGFLVMMYRNPRVLSITAEAVYDKDEFTYEYGLNPVLTHRPHRGSDRGEVMATYAVCKLRDTEPIFTVVEKHELTKLGKLSPNKEEFSARNSGKDVHHFMDIKAAIKKLSKLMQSDSSNELSKAIDYDSRLEVGGSLCVPILDSPDEIVVAELVDAPNGLESAFDGEEEESIESMDISQDDNPEKYQTHEKKEKNTGITDLTDGVENSSEKIVLEEKPITEQKSEPLPEEKNEEKPDEESDEESYEATEEDKNLFPKTTEEDRKEDKPKDGELF